MSVQPLPLIIGPDPIFRKTAEPVEQVDDEIRTLVKAMFATLYAEKGVGLGANMVGLLWRIIVIDLQDGSEPLACINPTISNLSKEMQTFTEGSLSFPGMTAEITRPESLTLTYLNELGHKQQIFAEGWLSQVIQHEIDYLDGRLFVDYLSKIKRDRLLKAYLKRLK